MKLVKCKIAVYNAADYRRVVDALLHAMLSHTATYIAPDRYTIVAVCAHILAEQNLDQVLRQLDLQGEKTEVHTNDPRPIPPPSNGTELQGPPALVDLPKGTFLISPSLKGFAG
jgi:hypothetical protein